MNGGARTTAYTPLNLQLRPLCQQRRTGSLIGVTRDGDSLMVTLKDGAIVGLGVKNVTGAAALDSLRAIGDCKSSFRECLLINVDDDLPTNEALLRALKVDVADGGVAPATTARNRPAVETDVVFKAVRDEASNLFGPFAEVFVDELLTGRSVSNDDDLRALLRELAGAIGEPDLAGTLIAKVLERTGFERRGRTSA